jgi:hypothetical protein
MPQLGMPACIPEERGKWLKKLRQGCAAFVECIAG